jgi:flagellar protein FlbD
VIILTRLGNGLPIAVNPDLIERAETTPDTVVTMMDGHKMVVEEPLEDVVALIREWRASIAAQAIALVGMMGTPPAGELDEDDAELAELAGLADSTAHHAASKGRLLRLPLREV